MLQVMNSIDLSPSNEYHKHSFFESAKVNSDGVEKCNEATMSTSISSKQEQPTQNRLNLSESDSICQVRIRSLSHWPHITPNAESMIAAGWFSCNVNDRVICIYCNTICHGWTIYDSPAEVHQRLAPYCPFVLSMPSSQKSLKIINETLKENFEPVHPRMSKMCDRETSFSKTSWLNEAPTVSDLAHAGFFFSGIENTVTCFYCNGSLHKWGPNDNPMIEHARWFPSCTYAKHLCGAETYERIQASKKQPTKQNQFNSTELSQLVAARLDLPMVTRLRSQYQISIIKRCIEDQLRIRGDDFASDTDLSVACMILKKQIDHINGCADNLIVPSRHKQSKTSSSSSKQSLAECCICLTEERQLACMPCGHLCACVPCGYALKSCPMCREKIQSFVRIN